MLAAPDSTYAKRSGRLFFLSLLLSVCLNGLAIHFLGQLSYSIKDHAFYLLIHKESAFEMRIGPAYEVKPAMPRFAKDAAISEGRYDMTSTAPPLSRFGGENDDEAAPSGLPPRDSNEAFSTQPNTPYVPPEQYPQRRGLVQPRGGIDLPADNLRFEVPQAIKPKKTKTWQVEEARFDLALTSPTATADALLAALSPTVIIVEPNKTLLVGQREAAAARIDMPGKDSEPNHSRTVKEREANFPLPETYEDYSSFAASKEEGHDDAYGAKEAVRIAGGFAVIYPERSMRLKEMGTVVLTAVITAEGRSEKITVVQSSGFPGLDLAALEAVRNARFHPQTIDGRPMPSQESFEIVFRLNDDTAE
jgi:TonB family C-terminal domain